ncbi:hypothetical protein BH23BAC1_BH23BAC1_26390 [soil metagenome]
MKKLILLLLIVTASSMSFNSFAQQGAYNLGDKIFMAGVSFGTYGYGYLGSRGGGIPLYASLEFGVHESISVGPYIGYASYNYGYGIYDYRWNFLSVGAKGSWHYLPLLNRELELNIDDDVFDFYVSLFFGYENRSFSGDDFGLNYANTGRLVFAPVLGFKYLFTPSVGAFVELGRGAFGYATVGVSVTF